MSSHKNNIFLFDNIQADKENEFSQVAKPKIFQNRPPRAGGNKKRIMLAVPMHL